MGVDLTYPSRKFIYVWLNGERKKVFLIRSPCRWGEWQRQSYPDVQRAFMRSKIAWENSKEHWEGQLVTYDPKFFSFATFEGMIVYTYPQNFATSDHDDWWKSVGILNKIRRRWVITQREAVITGVVT